MPRGRKKKVDATPIVIDDEEEEAQPRRRSGRQRGRPSAPATSVEPEPEPEPEDEPEPVPEPEAETEEGMEMLTAIKKEPEDPTPILSTVKSSTYLHTLYKYQQQALFCDTALKSSDGGLVMTHACVVAAASPFIYHQLVESKPSYFTVETSIASSLLSHLVEFMYTGRVTLAKGQTDDLLASADLIGLNLRGSMPNLNPGHPQATVIAEPAWAQRLFSTIAQFQKKGLFCDAELKSQVDGGLFSAHTCVIAASRNLLSQELAENGFFPDKLLQIIKEEGLAA